MFSWCAVSAAACALVSYQGLACNRKERVVMGGFYKRYSVMQQGWTVVKMFFQCMLLFVEEGDCLFGQLCSRCHPVDGQVLVKLALQVQPRRSST